MEKRLEILALDDDPLMIRFLEKALIKLNVGFYSAVTAHEGIDLLKARKESISLVLLDLSLPDKKWSATVDELLKIRSDLKIVISSGSLVDDPTHENDARIFSHLPKPFGIPDLQKLILSAGH